MKIYISGPMTGYNNFNYDYFDKVKRDLEREGFKVISPADIGRSLMKRHKKVSYIDFLEADLNALKECDAVYMIKGWRKSLGARIEHSYAKELCKSIFYEG